MSELHPQRSDRAAEHTDPTLLQQLGGEVSLNALVGAFYFNILRDARLSRFFMAADVDAVRNHQREFLAIALDGSNRPRKAELREAHRSLVLHGGLNQDHFDAMTDILASTLSQLGHPAALSQSIVNVVTALSGDVLGDISNPMKPTE